MKTKPLEIIVKIVAIIIASACLAIVLAPYLAPSITFFLPHEGNVLPFQPGKVISLEGNPIFAFLSYSASLIDHGFGYVLLILFLASMAGILLFAQYCKSRNPGRYGDGDSPQGNARLITSPLELKQKNDFWNGKGIPKKAGLVIGATKHGYYFDSTIPMWLNVGKTGSGKSQLQNIETIHLCAAAGWNLVITGKPELVELTGDKIAEIGYNRVIFDVDGYPNASRFNPLELITTYTESGNLDAAQKTARQTAADLIPLGEEKNTYFPKAARSILASLLLLVAYADIPKEQKNMATVCEIVNKGTAGPAQDPSQPLKLYIESLGSDHPAYAPAGDLLSDGGTTTAGKNVLSSLKEAISIFNDEGMRSITATSDIPMKKLIREKTMIYIHLLEENHPYMALFRVFINQWYRVAKNVSAEYGDVMPYRTAILGDELGNLGYLECVPEIVTTGRSRHLLLWASVQDLSQMAPYASKKSPNPISFNKTLNSIGGKVALNLGGEGDYAYFTKLCGKRVVRTYNQSNSQGSGLGNQSSSRSYNEVVDDLIHESDWKFRSPIHDGCIVVKNAENTPKNRAGVFQMPLNFAHNTPAGKFFGLGDEEFENQKRIKFRNKMKAQAQKLNPPAKPWCPDFAQLSTAEEIPSSVERDEWSAWDQ